MRLSQKVDVEGRSEVLLTTQVKVNDKVVKMRAKSEVRVRRDLFSPERGVDFSRRRVVSAEDRDWHIRMQEKLNSILTAVATAEIGANRALMTCEWLRTVVEHHLHPERSGTEDATGLSAKSFSALLELYLKKKRLTAARTTNFKGIARTVLRYEGYVRVADKRRRDFVFDVQHVDRVVIEDFMSYVLNEYELAQKSPLLFDKLANSYPEWLRGGSKRLIPRGSNVVVMYVKYLKTFFRWLLETGRTKNRPFDGMKIEGEKYGTPYYITTEERDRIAIAPMPTEDLSRQRDIFVFQCYVGCRIGDLMRLTAENVEDGFLTYAPHKTKDEGSQVRLARVPLHRVAKALIERYRGKDSYGRLFPFSTPKRYNRAIREIFRLAGVVRNVVVRNPLTGENEVHPINEMATSHLARRTFIGNAYKLVADPNIIGKMSGHADGSQAFSRYRNIEDETLRSVIDRL